MTITQIMDGAVTEQGYPGMVAEVRSGGQRWFGSAGVAELGTGRERLAEEQFRVGSITKTFTATVVLQLAAEYVLSLDDAVEKWLPGLVQGNGHDGSRIIIRHLLSHSSGLFAFTLDEDMLRRYASPELLGHRFDRWTPEELVKISLTHPADFEPGKGFAYSNTNFVLAGMIIERATGMSYADVVDLRIIRPLKLAGTYAAGRETEFRGRHTHSYSRLTLPDADAPAHDVTELDATYGFATGELVSTTADLATFLGALLGGRLLPPVQLDEMLTMTPVPDGTWLDGYSYGLGLSSFELPCGTTVYGHGGMITGNWSYLYGTRDGAKVAVTNVNGDWGCPPLDLFPEVLDAAFSPAD
ncbi:serine hydrolase domain-containing protein [Streptomyces alanosinicus]|uniref:D-alanyl-D-alanine carboxypeptidase n=1 Tax=Streptomyces alanosinicus TaxID=68171 RepID=A0A918YS71_9ACTN|nr:serine hydrolase domain-containing protein [Streptomyces alanosinicus]GHE14574.1 D-alanyl-D-alanine carboxypeptidase [Streptomyces alanosinicus]